MQNAHISTRMAFHQYFSAYVHWDLSYEMLKNNIHHTGRAFFMYVFAYELQDETSLMQNTHIHHTGIAFPSMFPHMYIET